MKAEDICTVTNRSYGMVIFSIPERHLRRKFYPGETQEVPFEELRSLANQPGGRELIYGYLLIRDPKAAKELMNIDLTQEVEYNMTSDQVKEWMGTSSLDAFKDALDFAPDGVKDLIKKYAVELPLNDVLKREALKEQLGFDVDKAIEIKKESETPDSNSNEKSAAPVVSAPTQRRVTIIKRN